MLNRGGNCNKGTVNASRHHNHHCRRHHHRRRHRHRQHQIITLAVTG